MTTRIFVPAGPRQRKALTPEPRIVDPRSRRDPLKHARWDTDAGDRDVSTVQAAGKQHMAGLAAEEGNRVRGFDRETHHSAARAIYSARQIDCIDARGGVHRRDHRAGETLHGST